MLKFLQWISQYLTERNICNEAGEVYLSRYWLWGRWLDPETKRRVNDNARISVYLHHFHKPDGDREPHNHPWKWAFAIILTGGYLEWRFFQRNEKELSHLKQLEYRPGSINRINENTLHLIKRLHGPVWSLFICGRAKSDWGFFIDGEGIVPHMEFFERKGMEFT